jgi:hypothetical protein
MRKHITSLLVVSGLALTSVTAVLAQKTPTLYDNLGGKKAITAVVDEFVARVAADNRQEHEGGARGHGNQQRGLRRAGGRPGRRAG